jgi:hypothetical protein
VSLALYFVQPSDTISPSSGALHYRKLQHKQGVPTMKKVYSQPQVKAHGSVKQLTQIAGNQATNDVLIFNNTVLAQDTQSKSFNLP